MIYNDEQRDLLGVPIEYAIAHCVSTDCKLGAGVAKQLGDRYGELRKACRDYIERGGYQGVTGHAYPVDCEEPSGEERIVFNLFVKRSEADDVEKIGRRSYLAAIEGALWDVREMADNLGIKKIAMPRVGCGLDRANWDDVREIIIDVFADSDIEILVCRKDADRWKYREDGASTATDMERT